MKLLVLSSSAPECYLNCTYFLEPDVNKKSKIKKRGNGIVSPLQECIQKAKVNLEGAVSETYHIVCFSGGADGSCADDSSAPLMSKYKN